MAVVAGLDGCPYGWVCLTKDLTNGRITSRILANISELVMLSPRPAVALVDVPIGLTDAGPRDCDREARRQLGRPRASSVFPAPVRACLIATSYEHACQLGQAADGRKLSRQSWGILPKIAEVDAFLSADTERQTWMREVHPEVSFWAWNGCNPMMHRKKSSAGRCERERLVRIQYAVAYESAKKSLPRGRYANDDLLDAFAALWSSERIVAGSAMLLPPEPPRDSMGLRMEIVA